MLGDASRLDSSGSSSVILTRLGVSQVLDQNRSKLDADQKFASADVSRADPANPNRDGASASQYVSRDDGLPDKRLSLFDRSNLDRAESSYYAPNSLYYLEHDNSQMLGAGNRALQQRLRAAYGGS